MAQVTKDTMIGELLQMDMNIAQILFECGMHCPGCPSARFETLEEAAFVHGFDCALLVEKINAYLAAKQCSYEQRKSIKNNTVRVHFNFTRDGVYFFTVIWRQPIEFTTLPVSVPHCP